MFSIRRFGALSLVGALAVGSVGCGHSEDEWQAKLKEIEALNTRLQQSNDGKKKCQNDLNKATDEIATLKADLLRATGDYGSLSKTAEEQRRLIARLKREKEQLDAIRKRFDRLKAKLRKLTKMGLNVTVRNNRMVIQLPGDILFRSGRTDLTKKGKQMILQVADVIAKDSGLAHRHYQVAGHTDGKPYAGALKDNWGLSLMRAREVLVLLTGKKDAKPQPGGGLDPKLWAAAGYGSTDPVAGNTNDAGRQKNRRVELVVLPNVDEMLDLEGLTKLVGFSSLF